MVHTFEPGIKFTDLSPAAKGVIFYHGSTSTRENNHHEYP